ncbi:Myb_DNA-binding domain-containing protein, partial [Cephalotus follicularis]
AKKLDEDICRWIIEFLLRQPIDDYKINKVLLLSVPNNNPKIKKLILLRSIQTQISDASIPETILETLETIEELDRQEKIPITNSMKAAYCAVAVECTVKYLIVSPGWKGKYFDAVKRIWSGKIAIMEESNETELVSDELLKWREEIEAALWDVKMSKKLLGRNTRNDAMERIRVYLGEAFALSGPTFLELAMRVMKKGKEKGKDSVPEGPGDATMEIGNSSVGTRRKHVPVYRRHGGLAKNTDSLELEEEDDAACGKYDSLPSPEVSKVQEALKASALELQALVKDPLPDALRMAEAVISHMAGNVENLEPLAENQIENDEDATNLPNPAGTGSVEEPVQAKEGDRPNQSGGHQNNLPKPSIMERNGTARTYEWEDSIDDSPTETSEHPSRIHLPSPKGMAVSPLRKYKLTKFARRRTMKRWSQEEEDALRKAVVKFGKGNWKVILNSNRDSFPERSEVDLKDKWRNMTRHRLL